MSKQDLLMKTAELEIEKEALSSLNVNKQLTLNEFLML